MPAVKFGLRLAEAVSVSVVSHARAFAVNELRLRTTSSYAACMGLREKVFSFIFMYSACVDRAFLAGNCTVFPDVKPDRADFPLTSTVT